MADSAQGIDVSKDQDPLTTADLDGLSFTFAKATEGPSSTDGNFAANWATMKDAGIHRGAYHELWSASSASAESQVDHFLAVVKGAGLEPGDMLAVVVSDYSGVTDAEVKTFLDLAQAAAPTSAVLVYSDLSALPSFTSCTNYGLWVTWPSDSAPSSVAPWTTWRFWQWGTVDDVDRDAYNGTASELQSWLNSVANPAHYAAPGGLSDTPYETSVDLGWTAVSGAPKYHYQVETAAGDAVSDATTTAAHASVTGLKSKTGYRWRVSVDPDGTWTSWKSFTTT